MSGSSVTVTLSDETVIEMRYDSLAQQLSRTQTHPDIAGDRLVFIYSGVMGSTQGSGGALDDLGMLIIWVAVFGAIMVGMFVLAIVLFLKVRKRWTQPNAVINPATRREESGTVTNVRYMGSMQIRLVEIGQTTRRPLFSVMVNVAGRTMEARVALQDETTWLNVRRATNSFSRMRGEQNPFQVGQTVRVEYDSATLGRCNILTPINQPMNQQPQQQFQQPQQFQQQVATPPGRTCAHCGVLAKPSDVLCQRCGSGKFK